MVTARICEQKDEPSHHNQDQPTANEFGNDLESERVSARDLVISDGGKEWKQGKADRPFPFLNLPPVCWNAKLVCGHHHPSCSSGWDFEMCDASLIVPCVLQLSWGMSSHIVSCAKAQSLKKPFVSNSGLAHSIIDLMSQFSSVHVSPLSYLSSCFCGS